MPLLHRLRLATTASQAAWAHLRRWTGADPNRGARFATPYQQYRLLNPEHQGFLLDGHTGALSLQHSYRNVLTLGPVGTGKTTIGVIPYLLRGSVGSKVVLDTSGEIFAQTAGYLHQRGYRIEVLNLMDPSPTGLQYNPFANRHTTLDLHKACHQLVTAGRPPTAQDSFWNEGAVTLLAILARCLQQHAPQSLTLDNLRRLVSRFDLFSAPPGQSFIDHLVCHATQHDDQLYSAYLALANGNPATVLSWVSTAANALTPLLSPTLADLTTCTSFRFQQLQQRPTILYIKVNQRDLEFYRFLLNLFFEDLLGSLTQTLHPDALPVFLLLDEFGQFRIDKFEVYAATARKYRIGMWLFLQSLSQLDSQYGPDKARTICNNLTTKLYFGGIELETATALERQLGQIKVARHDGQGLIYQHEPLLSADEIIRQDDQQFLIMSGNRPGFLRRGVPFYQQRPLQRRTQCRPPAVRSFTHTAQQFDALPKLQARFAPPRQRQALAPEQESTRGIKNF